MKKIICYDSLLQVPFCKEKSVQLFRVAFLRRDFFQNPYFKSVKPHREDTTALVLGWALSEPKHVKVYTKLYADEFGIGSHCYTLPMEVMASYDQDEQRKLAKECLEVISKQNNGKKIFIHCFSNNGFIFYQHMSQLLKENSYK